MNWKRIGTGTLCAAGVLATFDMVGLLVLQHMGLVQLQGMWVRLVGLNAPPTLLNAFLLSWLYVLVRPRLGPGWKTAFLMGTAVFALTNDHIVNIAYWSRTPGYAAMQLGFAWIKLISAISLAGWQYEEKAPS